MPIPIGYFVEESKPKKAKGSPEFLFSGGVQIPEGKESAHFYSFLKEKEAIDRRVHQ